MLLAIRAFGFHFGIVTCILPPFDTACVVVMLKVIVLDAATVESEGLKLALVKVPAVAVSKIPLVLESSTLPAAL